MSLPAIVVIFGPTAVGKTALAVDVALRFNGEVISADSRQFFKEISIGTAKPDLVTMRGIKHHFINSLSISENYTAGQFEKDGLESIEQIFENGKLPVIAGGSGLYIRALTEGIDHFPSNPTLRSQLNDILKKEGIHPLKEKLQQLDPERYKQTDLNNPMRVIRAIEIASTGVPLEHIAKKAKRNFRTLKIGLNMDRTALYQRIDQRVDEMMALGLEKEAEQYISDRDKQAFNTVGYKEMFEYLLGNHSLEEAVELMKRNSRRYAKRQLTWMRGERDLLWYSPEQKDEIMNCIHSFLHPDPH